MHRYAWAALVAIAVPSAGCGAATPALESGVYRAGDVAFRVGDAPATWRPIHVDQATLAWRDDANRASVLVDARCHQKDDDVPLLALTEHLLAGTTDRKIASEETLPFDAREALHTRLQAKLDGVTMSYDLFVTKKDGCIYDFVYVLEPSAGEAGTAPFERFVSTFHTLGAAP